MHDGDEAINMDGYSQEQSQLPLLSRTNLGTKSSFVENCLMSVKKKTIMIASIGSAATRTVLLYK